MSRLEAAMRRLKVLPKAGPVPVHRVETTDTGPLRVTVELPLLSSSETVTLDLNPTGLRLAEPAVGYTLELSFPCTVDEGGAAAKFDKKARVLTITLPVVGGGTRLTADVDVHVRRTWVGRFDKLQKRFPDAPKQSILAALTEHDGHEGKAASLHNPNPNPHPHPHPHPHSNPNPNPNPNPNQAASLLAQTHDDVQARRPPAEDHRPAPARGPQPATAPPPPVPAPLVPPTPLPPLTLPPLTLPPRTLPPPPPALPSPALGPPRSPRQQRRLPPARARNLLALSQTIGS